MGIEPAIDITDEQRETVLSLLERHLSNTTAWVYGSRAKWTARPQSDLDMVVFTTPEQNSRVFDLREAFEESNLPFRVDLFVWDDVPERFRKHIEQDYVVLMEKAQSTESGWGAIQLRDIAELVMGQSPPGTTYNEIGGGLPFFQGVKDFNYRLPSPRVFCSAPSRIAQPGDILFSVRAPIGRVNIADRKCATGRGLAIIKPRIQSDARYIEFYLRHIEPTWNVIEGNGSVFGNATKKDLETLRLWWPPKLERNAIAHILGTLDDKIELNRRMNETLEEMARAIFKDWFVDFGPTRAKMEGRDTGLPPEVAALFPDRLVESELGEVPEGWEVETVGECFYLTMGQSPPSSTYNEHGEGLPFFQGRTDFGFRYPENRKFCTAPARIAQPEDTLVSVRAPVGDINMAWEQCCIGRGVAALRHKLGSSSFTYYAAGALQRAIQQYEHTGTVFGAINKQQFEEMPTIEPTSDVVDAFGMFALQFDRRIRSNVAESRTLAALRVALLPKLVSGEMRVGPQ